MSHAQLPANLYVTPAQTGEVLPCGAFRVDVKELRYAEMEIFKKGTRGGSERARINVYSTADRDVLLYSSDWRDFDDVTGFDDDAAWLGRVRFDFARQNVNELNDLFLGLEIENYTRDGTNFYIGARIDYPRPVAAEAPSGIAMVARTWFYGWGVL